MNTPILRKSPFSPVRRIITRETPGEPVPPEWPFRLDRHPHREILLCLAGTCIYPVNGKLFRLEPGTAVLLEPWCPHAYGYRECDRDFAHIWYGMGEHAMLYQIDARGKRLKQTRKLMISAAVRDMVSARWQLAERAGEDAPPYLLTALNALQEDMLALPEEAANPLRRDEEAVNLVRAIILRRSGRDCSLDFLAGETGYSACHLAHLVQRITGRTIGQLIDATRMEYVLQARNHGLMQKEIAANLGFSSAAAFGNWLRRHYTESRISSSNAATVRRRTVSRLPRK